MTLIQRIDAGRVSIKNLGDPLVQAPPDARALRRPPHWHPGRGAPGDKHVPSAWA